jgi:steroid delta-isomerase-like uncharacterized protein
MSTPDNKAVIFDYVHAFNRGDLDGLCRLFAPDALVDGVLGWGRMDKVRPVWEQLITCFKMNLQVEMMIEEGDVVAVRYTERGVFSAPYRGTPPTGKSYEVVAMEWFVFRDGVIIRRWGARNSAAIFRQMGIPLKRAGQSQYVADWLCRAHTGLLHSAFRRLGCLGVGASGLVPTREAGNAGPAGPGRAVLPRRPHPGHASLSDDPAAAAGRLCLWSASESEPGTAH